MSSLYVKPSPIVPIVAAAVLTGKEGHFYKLNGSNQAILCSAVTDQPDGLISAVPAAKEGLEITALKAGGNHGTVKVKLGAAVTDLRLDLTLRADGTCESDDGTGARVIVARPLETGAADELIEAVLLKPRALGALVADTTTNGACAAAADLAALKTETEAMGDTLRAALVSLKASGLLN